MAEESSGERSEEPTGRRLEQAREKGQIARSKELGTAAVLISAATGFYMLGPGIATALSRVFEQVLTMDRAQIYDTNQMVNVWGVVASEITWPLSKIMLLIAFVAFIGNISLGGMNFSTKAMMPKASKMSPLAGFKRMFGVQAVVELTKGIAKFSVVAFSAYLLLSFYFND
ncbi:MAG: EscU/YscU/HrcU family type III secretion system export apparatus switch protein, partial [Shewanella sp.]